MASLLRRLEAAAAGRGSLLSSSISLLHSKKLISSCAGTAPPRLMLPPAYDGHGNKVFKFYNLAENRVESLLNTKTKSKEEEEEIDLDACIVGSSHGWLAFFSQKNRYLFLFNPLSRRHIKLPPYQPLEVPSVYFPSVYRFCVSKVILSSSPEDDEEECRVLMSFGFGVANRLAFCLPGKSTHWTSVAKSYDLDEKEDDEEIIRGYSDNVYSARHQLLFSITGNKFFQVVDLSKGGIRLSDRVSIGELKGEDELHDILHRSVVQPPLRQPKYLVLDDEGQLFLVRQHIMPRVGPDGVYVRSIHYGYRRGYDNSYPYKTIGFDVHRIDWDSKCGVTNVTYVEPGGGSLDGLAMFVGLNHSFALSAAKFPGLKPNCIYFTDTMTGDTSSKREDWIDNEPPLPRWIDKIIGGRNLGIIDNEPPHPRWVENIYGGHDLGIFSYEDRTFSPCYYPCDIQSIKRISPPPIWFNN